MDQTVPNDLENTELDGVGVSFFFAILGNFLIEDLEWPNGEREGDRPLSFHKIVHSTETGQRTQRCPSLLLLP